MYVIFEFLLMLKYQKISIYDPKSYRKNLSDHFF